MKVPISWLKELVNFECTPQEYSDRMTMSGSKVEGIENKGKEINGVVVGKINSIESHENADKLVVCQVDVKDEVLQIVTGANNIKEGDYIPVAKIGATLPGEFKIKKTKLRGVESNGMMCSVAELGITKEDYPNAIEDGILIFNQPYELGMDAKIVLGLDEDIVEFEITSNRPDCFSVLGLARETAVTFGKNFNMPNVNLQKIDKSDDVNNYAKVEVEDFHLCPRYMARVIKNVKIAPSPDWLRNRLRACGIRAINNIVDITNYVLLEYGQPMHAFDLNYLKDGNILVRKAKKGEKIETLDEQKRNLDENMLVITDGIKPVAVAGVMGGANSEINENTNTILFECANFEPSQVRLTAKKLGLRTDSSARFEKGLDPYILEAAINRACELVEELNAGVVVGGTIDAKGNLPQNKKILLRPEKINKFLGTNLTKEYMVELLQKLDFKVSNDLNTIVPTFRPDVETEADLSEEIARFYGYDKIIPTFISGESVQGGKNSEQKLESNIIDTLTALGYYEIYTYSFTSPKVFDMLNMPEDSEIRKAVVITNPLGEENSIMRTTTLSSMLEVMSRNYNQRAEKVRLFEIGKVYNPKSLPLKELPDEKKKITLGMYGDGDFYDFKGAIEELLNSLKIEDYNITPCKHNPSFHPGRTASLTLNGKEFAIFGEIHPNVLDNYDIKTRAYIGVLDFDTIIEKGDEDITFKQLPKYPAVTRDLAVVINDDIMVKEIEAIIKKISGNLLERIELFDVYRGEQISKGKKSVAYSISLRAEDRTLKEEEINKVFDKIIDKLRDELNAQLRD